MTSEEFAPVSTVPVNLRQAAMDLVHRLSSLRDFIPAANDLATCDSLPPKDVQRHCRKIVTLIEIAHSTLTRSGVRLQEHSSCMPALVRHKAAYFSLLHMLQRQRHLMQEDESFQDRVDRLLLPLAANGRGADSEDTAAFPSTSYRAGNVAPAPPPPCPPSCRPASAHAQRQQLKLGSASNARMLPPDVLLGRPVKQWGPEAWKHAHLVRSPQRGRKAWPDTADDDGEGSDDDDDEEQRPVLVQQSRRRFGIFCTNNPSAKRLGSVRR